MLRLILLFITTLLTYCQSQINTHSKISFDEKFEEKMFTDPTIFKVDGFVDGDTFWVLNADSQRVKIRLIGIDAPENKNVFNKKKHPFGVHAKAYTDSILTKHSYLKLAFDVDSIDRYGRTLAYVYLNDGTFLNEDLVKNGYATVMTISPNVKHDKLFYEAQVFAREHKLGIWKD